MIEYFNRYSDTDLPDKMGRWARIAVYKNIRIAWISRIEYEDKMIFSVTLHFPTMQNDTANESIVCESLLKAKEVTEERWNWFLKTVS
jgi:hypothetical protein